MVIVSAPGKIHLMGEHSVVYGKPALLTAINRRLFVRIDSTENVNVACDAEIVHQCLSIMQKTYHIEDIPGMNITITSTIPIGSGLGSSASLAVATLGALHLFLKKGWNPTTINELAYEVEKTQHGNPSGGDNTAVTFGGFLWYRREFEFLKSMWQLPFRIAKNLKPFVLINSGKPKETTGEMIAIVGERIKNKELRIKKIFSDQEELTKRMTLALKNGDEDELITSIKEGEKNLEKLGVVGKKATTIIRIIEKHGGAAKISGAGGIKGGSGMLLVYHPKPEILSDGIKKNKWEAFSVTLGEEGVRREI